jgi:hypothetical protein
MDECGPSPVNARGPCRSSPQGDFPNQYPRGAVQKLFRKRGPPVADGPRLFGLTTALAERPSRLRYHRVDRKSAGIIRADVRKCATDLTSRDPDINVLQNAHSDPIVCVARAVS